MGTSHGRSVMLVCILGALCSSLAFPKALWELAPASAVSVWDLERWGEGRAARGEAKFR